MTCIIYYFILSPFTNGIS